MHGPYQRHSVAVQIYAHAAVHGLYLRRSATVDIYAVMHGPYQRRSVAVQIYVHAAVYGLYLRRSAWVSTHAAVHSPYLRRNVTVHIYVFSAWSIFRHRPIPLNRPPAIQPGSVRCSFKMVDSQYILIGRSISLAKQRTSQRSLIVKNGILGLDCILFRMTR